VVTVQQITAVDALQVVVMHQEDVVVGLLAQDYVVRVFQAVKVLTQFIVLVSV
jgi:hypothetical protein